MTENPASGCGDAREGSSSGEGGSTLSSALVTTARSTEGAAVRTGGYASSGGEIVTPAHAAAESHPLAMARSASHQSEDDFL
jgi:hypothetical protein